MHHDRIFDPVGEHFYFLELRALRYIKYVLYMKLELMSSRFDIYFQIYRERERDRDRSIPNIHELSTRTVTMSRDQQPDGSHGFGICVKGGKDSGMYFLT